MDKKQKIETNLKKMFQEIIQENHDHSIMKPIRAKCNKCKYRIPKTAKCSLLYPNGITKEITHNQKECKEFAKK